MNVDIALLDEIIVRLTPESIPTAFLNGARVTDMQGEVHVLRGDHMANFLANLQAGNPQQIAYAQCQVTLNLPLMRSKIMNEVLSVYREAGIND